ncbi:hypothetical protein [Microvirga sp. 2TAF3]|uniref:hypothetical protein n=1 Tax=Microvirga sp. 2TAF3 TaxID=3233014 RepID=UPI003F95C4CC
MVGFKQSIAALCLLGLCAAFNQAHAECSGASIPIYSARSEGMGEIKVKAGTGCSFNINNIPGAVQEAKIIQQPKVGRAGVSGLTPFYAAKPGYNGPDEFAYAFLGMDQYGGPMNVVIKWRVTVVP